MNKHSMRRAFVVMALVAGAGILASSQVFAACGGVASLMNKSLAPLGLGVVGRNIVSIPAVSPINDNAVGSPGNNGFTQLCRRFGLTGTTSTVTQTNPATGAPIVFTCNAAAAPDFLVGQAVVIVPSVAATGRIPGVECSAAYTAIVDGLSALGDNYMPIPVTFTGTTAEDICTQMALPAGSTIIRFDAAGGTQPTHNCGQTPQFNLKIGEGMLVRPLATRSGSLLIF